MTKKELIERMAAKANLTEAQTEEAFKALVVTMTDALKDGDKVIFPGFGTYEVRTRPARMGRNPFTNEAMQIPERRVPAFKPFRALKDAVAMAPRNTAVYRLYTDGRTHPPASGKVRSVTPESNCYLAISGIQSE